ncbi:bestrophin-like domain [Acidisoma sp. C75]
MSLENPWISLVALSFMLLAVCLGATIRKRWPEHHSNRETIELLQTTVMLLATFAAIVLGLLITSAKKDFDNLQNDVRGFGATLVQLDYTLAELGPEAVPIRHRLVRYAAAATAIIWSDEAPPPGNYYPRLPASKPRRMGETTANLGQMLQDADSALQSLPSGDAAQTRRLATAERLMTVAIGDRWHIVEASRGSLSTPFFAVLVFWAIVIYLCFGLSAPLNHVNAMTMTLSAVALASALFVIIDLYTPYTGIFSISSAPLRGAIRIMLSLPEGMPGPFSQTCQALAGCE